jgi:parallel beta-helix repeat protein
MRYAFLLLLSMQCAALPLWNGWVEVEGDPGNRRSIGRVATLLPFCDTGDSTSFVYVRGLWDNNHAREGDFGLGYRWLCDDSVWGGYLFYDYRKSSHHNSYQQLTVGLERYTSCFEARLNGYLSLTGEREMQNSGFSQAIIRGDQVRFLCRPNDFERGLPGLDGEIGYRYCCGWLEAKLLVGGYWFNRECYEKVAGLKGRAELSVNDLPYGTKLTLGIEGYGDDIRSGEVSAIVRLQVPFGGCSRPCDLCSRLYERIERLDLLTRTRKSPLCESAALFKGREISEVVFAAEDLVVDVATAPENALIVVNGEFGVEETVAMKLGQILAGGGAELVMTGECPCGPGILTVPGEGGIVTVSRGEIFDPLIDVATDGTVAGLTIESLTVAVQATDAPRVMVMDNTISTQEPSAHGVFLGASEDCEVLGNNVSTIGVGARGIYLDGSDDGTVTGNTISTEGSSAYGVRLEDGSNGGALAGNTISTKGSNAYGVWLVDSDDGTVTGNTISTEGERGHGVVLNNSDKSAVTRNTIEAEGSIGQGVVVIQSNDGTVAGNSVSTKGSSAYGVLLFLSTEGTVKRNSISTDGTGAFGVWLDSNSNNGTVTGNTIEMEGSTAVGIRLSNSSDDCEVSGNRVSTSGMDAPGTYASDLDSPTIVNNTIDTTGDNSDGILLETVTNPVYEPNTISVSGTGSQEVVIVP